MTDEITGDYVLQMAERIEANGSQFYILAAGNAGPEARMMLMRLAEMEEQHRRQFGQLRTRLALAPAAPIDLNSPTAAFVRTHLGGKFFDASADPQSTFTGTESFQDILLTAIGLERQSIEFYEAIKTILSDRDGLQLVDLIIHEEMQHIRTLAAQLDAPTPPPAR